MQTVYLVLLKNNESLIYDKNSRPTRIYFDAMFEEVTKLQSYLSSHEVSQVLCVRSAYPPQGCIYGNKTFIVPSELGYSRSITDVTNQYQSSTSLAVSISASISSSSHTTTEEVTIKKLLSDCKVSSIFLQQDPQESDYDIYMQVAYQWRHDKKMDSILRCNSEYLKKAAVGNVQAAALLFSSLKLASLLQCELESIYQSHAHNPVTSSIFLDKRTIRGNVKVVIQQVGSTSLQKIFALLSHEYYYLRGIKVNMPSFTTNLKTQMEVLNFSNNLYSLMKKYQRDGMKNEITRLQQSFAAIVQEFHLSPTSLKSVIGKFQKNISESLPTFNQHNEGTIIFLFHQLKGLVSMLGLFGCDITIDHQNLAVLFNQIGQAQDKLEQDKGRADKLGRDFEQLNQTQLFIDAGVKEDDIPAHFRCNLCCKVMRNPVYVELPDGEKYYLDRLALDRHLAEERKNHPHDQRNPVTMQPYDQSQIHEATELKAEMEQFLNAAQSKSPHRSAPSLSAAGTELFGLLSGSSSRSSEQNASGHSSSSVLQHK